MDKNDRSSRPSDFTPLRKKEKSHAKRRFDTAKVYLLGHKLWLGIAAIVISLLIIGAAVYFARDTQPPTSNNEVVKYYQQQLPGLSDKVKQTPDDPIARRDYAVALYATGDVEAAKQQYEFAIKLKGNDATLHNNLGNTHRDLGDYDKAIASYETAIKLNPQHQNAYINMANIQQNSLKKPEDAITTYHRAITALPDDTQLKLLLGLAYEQAGNIPEAVQTFKSIIKTHPDHQAAHSNLERLGAD